MENENLVNIDTIEDCYSQVFHITGELSRGGQGVVLKTTDPRILIKVAIDSSGNFVQDPSCNDVYLQLRLLPIDSKQHITLPISTLKHYEGYVMRMLSDMETFREHFDIIRDPSDLHSTPWIDSAGDCSKIFANHYTTGGTRRRLEAFLKSGSLLSQLHNKGLVYCDYSPNNAFISKNHKYCNVWLIDADNLKNENIALRQYLYTPGIAAPEIEAWAYEDSVNIPHEEGQGEGNSFSSDTYTFAVCLFKEIAFCDPFDGKAYNEDLDNCDDRTEIDINKDAGYYAYIEDDEDDSNTNDFFESVADFAISDDLRELFGQTFSTNRGKSYRWLRPTMLEYCAVLAKATDHVLRCSNCGMDFFRNNKQMQSCPWCEEQLPRILKLKSYYYEAKQKQSELWTYEREADKDFAVPLRLITGFRISDIDDVCFKITNENGKCILDLSFDNGYKILYSKDGMDFKNFGKVEVSDKFYLRVINESSKAEVYIEGEIEE